MTTNDGIVLFLCGDVMTGRGIDQILPYPSDPRLYEDYVHSARDHVALAERAHGPIARPVAAEYVRGAALGELERVRPSAVDLVHGHSSHHVKAIEVHRGKLILYGCGDLLTDYEGIGDREDFRGDLSAMYFPLLDPASGRLLALSMTVTQTRRLQVRFARAADTGWLAARLEREGRSFGTQVLPLDGPRLALRWT